MAAGGVTAARVTAVIVIWNSAALTINLLRTLEEAFGKGLRMVLVDNASADGSFETMQRFLDGWGQSNSVSLLRSEVNLGFTGGVNLGTKVALEGAIPPDFIWLLNPDSKVNEATVWELVAVARESGAGMVSPRGHTNRYIPTDAWPREFWSPHRRMATPSAAERWWKTGRYSGSCVVFDAALVRELITRDGHFQDESIFMDWDEWDTTLRAARLGRFPAGAGDAYELHLFAGRTLGRTAIAATRQYYWSRNSIVVARRYLPWWQFLWMLPMHLARDLSWFPRVRLRGEQPNERAYILGAIDGLRGKMGRWSEHPARREPTPDGLPPAGR